jgi:hypothetical protein
VTSGVDLDSEYLFIRQYDIIGWKGFVVGEKNGEIVSD